MLSRQSLSPMKRLALPLLALVFVFGAVRAGSTPPPRHRPAHAFEPVTARRIAALPADKRPAWQAYWIASQALAARVPVRAAAGRPPLKPVATTPKGAEHKQGLRLDAPAARYGTTAARAIADRVVACQSPTGAWGKGNDYTRPPSAAEPRRDGWVRHTIDNDATILELRFLARVLHAGTDSTRSAPWSVSFDRGLAYVFAAIEPDVGRIRSNRLTGPATGPEPTDGARTNSRPALDGAVDG